MLNLLSNALKYTPGGAVRVALQRRGSMVELSVADTGLGIPPDEREHTRPDARSP